VIIIHFFFCIGYQHFYCFDVIKRGFVIFSMNIMLSFASSKPRSGQLANQGATFWV